MTPKNDKMTYERRNSTPARNMKPRRRNGTGPVDRIKMLIAAGAVAGTLGGWATLAQYDALASAQAASTPSNTAALVAQSPTATPQATAQQATATATSQATAAVTQAVTAPTQAAAS